MKKASRNAIHQRIFFLCTMGVSLFLPVFPKAVPPVIVLMTLSWLIDAPFVRNFRLVVKERERWLLVSFSLLYFIYLICLSYSENLKYGVEDLETKLSLLIFPVILSTQDREILTRKEGFRILISFVSGCFIGSLLLLGHSWYNEAWNKIPEAFYYGNLSWFFHSTYLSMYLVFAVAIIAWMIIFRKRRLKPIVKILLLVLSIYFLLLIVLLSSKAGLISLIVVSLFFSSILIIKKRNWITGVTILITSLLTLYLGLLFFPLASLRIITARRSVSQANVLKSSRVESTAERIHIWRAGWEIVKEHPLTGTGTGDVKDELLIKYRKNNIKPAYEKRLNAHNQYLQTFIATGIFGFLALLLMIFLPVISSFRREQFLYLIFLLIFALNIMFESMLEVQAGVVFYAFFNSFLFWTRKWDFTSMETT